MLARIEYWRFSHIAKDFFGRWRLHYFRNGIRCKRTIRCTGAKPLGQEVVDTVAEIMERKLTRCEETDVLNLVEVKGVDVDRITPV